jgi:adenylate cyclase
MSAPFNLEAYCHALEAQAHLERGGRRNTAMAVDLYSLAVECDPHSPIGHAGLAKALVFSCAYYGPDRSKLMRAETHCSAALRAEPGSAEALAALGFLTAVRGDHRGGCERFIQSLARAPQSSETHYLIGRSCLVAGEYRAAAAILERAASLRDDDYQSLAFAGKMRLKLGEEASARANFVRGLRRAEAFLQSWPDSYRAVRCLADCLWHLGRKAEAVALLDRMLNHDDPMPYYNASFLALAGETDVALETLSDAVDEGWRHAAFLAHDQDFDSLRGEIRFRRIARTAGAEA